MSDHATKSVLQEVKKEIELLEDQFKKSKKELRDAYQQKKEILSSLVKKVHSCVSAIEKKGSGKLGALKRNSKDLLEILDSDFDISYTEFEDTAHDLNKAVHDFEKSLEAYYEEFGSEAKKTKKCFEDEIKNAISQFKKELAQQRSFYSQLTEKPASELESWKIKRLNDIGLLKQKINTKVSESKRHTGKFKKIMGEAYETLKSAYDEVAH